MSFRRLRRAVAEVDEVHRASMTTIHDDLADAHLGTAPEVAASRRHFLRRAATGGAVAVGASVVTMSAMAEAALAQTGGTTPGTQQAVPLGGAPVVDPAEGTTNDLAIVLFAHSVELAAVAAYGAMIDTKLFDSAAAETARTFRRHHTEHAAALATIAEAAEATVPTDPNAALVAALVPQITGAGDQTALAQLSYQLEDGAAATYLFALGELTDWQIAGAASKILPVEGQHAVVWSQIAAPDLEAWAADIQTYIPNFQTTDGAFDPTTYPVG